MLPYPTGSWYIDGILQGNGTGFMGFDTAECCGLQLLKYYPIGWNWGGAATVTATNIAANCPSPETESYPAIPKPDCLDEWLTVHGGLDQVTVGLDGCTPMFSGLTLSDYVLIPRELLEMESQTPPVYCGTVAVENEQLQVATGKFACVTINAVDGSTMSCTTCIIWADGCAPCSSSGSDSSGSNTGGDSSGSVSSGDSSSGGSGGDGGSDSSSSDVSDGSSDSGSSSSGGSGGDGGCGDPSSGSGESFNVSVFIP